MRTRLGLHRHSLTVQMLISSILLVLLTAVAAGLPAMLLLRKQIDARAWAQVHQGEQATAALFDTWHDKVADLATLTAQRPTLQTLLDHGSPADLHTYLQTLRAGTDLSLILVCDAAGTAVAQDGPTAVSPACPQTTPPGFHLLPGAPPRLWLLAGHVVGPPQAPAGHVVVGVHVNDAFLAGLQAQTGMAHTLRGGDAPLASSLPPATRSTRTPTGSGSGALLRQNGRFYYTTDLPLAISGSQDAAPLRDAVALDITDVVTDRRRLAWTLAGSTLLVSLLASGIGILMARRIGQPLAELAAAADHIRAGNLDTALTVSPRIHDVSVVAATLEEARRELQQTLHALRSAKAWSDQLLDAIVEGIVTLDRHGHITFFSPGAERIMGQPREAVLGRSCDRVFQPAGTDERFSQLIPPPGKQRRIELALPDGRQATVAVTGAPLAPPGANHVGIALVFRDVSEAELMHRLLGQFLANVTHEFRTPLSAVAASAELLRDQAADLDPAEMHQLLNSLHLGIVGLQTLIDNLLESASLEVGRFRIYPRRCDLGELIAEAAQLLQPLCDKYGQRLLIALPLAAPIVQADPRRTVQVLINLLSNAIKYGPESSTIELAVTQQEARVRVAVADRGPGVPAGYGPQLFQRFARTQSAAATAQVGAGLGLFVAKSIVEAHGGQMGVADREGGGAVFWFTLPLAAAPSPAAPEIPHASPDR
ncbi:MAG: PAS domain-containing protein [Anaerolineales bacterium]|nr:PAS domain-containing protein [Anaerolineales bacterium]